MSELQAEFNQKLIEHLEALEKRLSSIEKLLSAESKPEPQEPEWRPMSDAPMDGTIRVKLSQSAALRLDADNREANDRRGMPAKFDKGLWKVDDFFLMTEKQFVGWRPL